MEDDPAFLERRRHRFDDDDPPPPYSSGGSTELPTPEPFSPVAHDIDIDELLRKPFSDKEIRHFGWKVKHYLPCSRYKDEFDQERNRIDREWRRRDANYIPLYRGPDLIGRAGQQKLPIMIRHSIKKRWKRLGVWDPEWGIPNSLRDGPKDNDYLWYWKWDRKQSYRDREYDRQPHEVQLASWPSRDEELPHERSVRLYLERQDEWNEALDRQPSDANGPTEVYVDDGESMITSRPWYVWKLEVAEEDVRLSRDPENSGTYHQSRENVTTRWKEKGYWKDSWSDLPGWKWRHESPSPEPADPNQMDFTPSEIDAMEEILPPTPPPPPPAPSSLERQGPTWSKIFGFLPLHDPNPSPPASPQLTQNAHADGNDDHDYDRPEAIAKFACNAPPQRFLDQNTSTTWGTEHGESFPAAAKAHRRGELRDDHKNNHEHQRQPTTRRMTRSVRRPDRSGSRSEKSSPVNIKTRMGRNASRALTRSSKISKPTPPSRRSARIAERERQPKGTEALSKTLEAIYKGDPAPQPSKQPRQQKQKTSIRVTTRRKDSPKATHPPTLSKPQRVTKRRGRPRSKRLNA